MKKWKCVEVKFEEVGNKIEEHQKEGWCLHTYNCAGAHLAGGPIGHFLLFEKEAGS